MVGFRDLLLLLFGPLLYILYRLTVSMFSVLCLIILFQYLTQKLLSQLIIYRSESYKKKGRIFILRLVGYKIRVKGKFYVEVSFGALFHVKDECVAICIPTTLWALNAMICY